MEQKKVYIGAERVKAIALCFIGSALCVYGTTYFHSQAEYHMPRILSPVFYAFGNVGLAIGMLLLGAGVVFYSMRRWQKFGGNTLPFIGIIASSIALFLSLFSFTVNSDTEKEQFSIEESTHQREKLIEEVMKTERPVFDNKEADSFMSSFEELLAGYRRHAENGDEQAMDKDWEIHNEMLMEMSSVVEQLSNDDKHLFAQYHTKLRIEWGEVRRK